MSKLVRKKTLKEINVKMDKINKQKPFLFQVCDLCKKYKITYLELINFIKLFHSNKQHMSKFDQELLIENTLIWLMKQPSGVIKGYSNIIKYIR